MEKLGLRRARHREHVLDHELRREQAHSGDHASSAQPAGPVLGGPVGEVEMQGSEVPLPARDESVDEPPAR